MTAQMFYNDRSIGFVSSFFLHVVLFFLSGFVFAKPIEYAVELGNGGIEISLTAAPAEPTLENQTIPKKSESAWQEEPAIPEPDDMPLPEDDVEKQKSQEPKTEIKEEKKEIQTAVGSLYKGDGSSPIPGKDKTTFYSSGGAMAGAKPNYLKNPAPAYPWEARKNGWRGVVILKVFVDAAGDPIKVEVETGSGYDVLDKSAVKTVNAWRFQPARLGHVAVESSVRIPIRFEFENLKHEF